MISSVPKYVSYKGIVESEKSADVLKDYYCLLFPTRYYTEGMPGTIIDAMFAGLPVISRKWAYCDQMLTNRYNGLVYDFERPDDLFDCMLLAVENIDLIFSMKQNCLEESKKYSEEVVVKRILLEMEIQFENSKKE